MRSLPAIWRNFRRVWGRARRLGVILPVVVVLVVVGRAPAQRPDDGAAVAEVPRSPYLGVFVGPIPPSLAAQLEGVLPADGGLLVTGVVPRSPAARAGLEQYDVVVRFAGAAVIDEGRLRQTVEAAPAGQPAKLEFIRRAARRDVEISPEIRPRSSSMASEHRARALAGLAEAAGSERDVRKGSIETDVADAPHPDGALRVATSDGRTFRAAWRPSDAAADSRAIEVTRDTLDGNGTDWPKPVLDDLRRLIEGERSRAALDARADGAAVERVRVHVQPRLQEGRRGVRLVLEIPGTNGERRAVQVDHTFQPGRPPSGAALLDSLKSELESLSPAVREGIEKALRSLRIPEVRVDVQSAL